MAFSIIVCAALLLTMGYFAVLCCGEAVFWLRDRLAGKQLLPQVAVIRKSRVITH
jgi:hypothetical protein